MQFKMSSAVCFDLDQSKILSSSNELTLPQTKKNLNCSKLKAYADYNFKFNLKWQKFFKSIENDVGKIINCLLQAISPFPTVFSKDLSCRNIKSRACLGQDQLDLTHDNQYLYS